jgi:hypothetical protein
MNGGVHKYESPLLIAYANISLVLTPLLPSSQFLHVTVYKHKMVSFRSVAISTGAGIASFVSSIFGRRDENDGEKADHRLPYSQLAILCTHKKLQWIIQSSPC